MKCLRNNKGMTLVEITITLLIASIIMVMAGSILISTVSFYDKHAISDFDKSSLDSAFDNVANQLEYATGIKISKTPLTSDKTYKSWRYYHVKDGRLYARFGDETKTEQDLYENDFYHGRKIVMKTKKLDEDKLSLKMDLKEDEDTVYDRKRSITVKNITLAIKEDTSAGIVAPGDEEYTDYYVYYKLVETEKVEREVTGTVADELYCMDENPSLNRGEFSAPNTYKAGDFVTYNGQYYRFQGYPGSEHIIKVGGSTPDKMGSAIKLISEYYITATSYQIGDVVVWPADSNPKRYFKSLMGNNLRDPSFPFIWEEISADSLPNDKVCRIKF